MRRARAVVSGLFSRRRTGASPRGSATRDSERTAGRSRARQQLPNTSSAWGGDLAKAIRGAAPRCGPVSFVQRFGGALNVDVHFHALLLKGVYTRLPGEPAPVLREAPWLEDSDVQRLVETIASRVIGLLTRRGVLDQDDPPPAPLAEEEPLRAGLLASSVTGTVATGARRQAREAPGRATGVRAQAAVGRWHHQSGGTGSPGPGC